MDQKGSIALGFDDGSISVWDLQRGIVSSKLGKGENLPAVTDIAFSSDGKGLFSSSLDKDIIEWDLQVISFLAKYTTKIL